jgi:hypothetical protein
MNWRMTTAALFVLVGCRREPTPGLDTSAPDVAIVKANPAGTSRRGSAAVVADWQDPTCEVDTTHAHPDARLLVREYVARNDSLGFFAGGGDPNNDWLFAAAECPGHLGGTDGAVVVQGDTIEELSVSADSAAFAVRYAALGSTTPSLPDQLHMRFVPDTSAVVDTVRLVRTPYGWRLSGDVGAPFMGPDAVLRQANLDSASVRALDSTREVVAIRRPAP